MDQPTEWRGWAWPNELTVDWENDGCRFVVKGRMTPNGPQIEDVSITGINITGGALREPIASRFRAGFSQAIAQRQSGEMRVSLRPGGRPPNPEAARNRLEEVVAAYHGASPGHKQETVANAMNVSKNYARRLISMARRAGLIQV